MDAPNLAVTRRAAISWFIATQASKIVRDGAIPEWFHGIISRRDAEELLKDKSPGCFLIRVGESRIGFSLSYRGFERCRHFIIDVSEGGEYNISGELNSHHTLQDLVTFHRRVPIAPFTECLTVPCGQVTQANAEYEELCIFVPTRKNSPTPHSYPSAGNSCPTTSHSASNNSTSALPKQVAICPPIPLKGQWSSVSPPTLPRRGVTNLKPVPKPKAMTDEPPLLSGRVLVKRLYPSLRMEAIAISMQQQPTTGAIVSGPHSVLLPRYQPSSAGSAIRDPHNSVSHSKSELKQKANPVGNVYSRHPEPAPAQGQAAEHTTDTNSLARKCTGGACPQLSPVPPRVAHSQAVSHHPALHPKPVSGYQPLTDCAEGEPREHESGRVDLPTEYLTPPPYAPGYQPSQR